MLQHFQCTCANPEPQPYFSDKQGATLLCALKTRAGTALALGGEYVADACDYSRSDLADTVAGASRYERLNSHSDRSGGDFVCRAPVPPPPRDHLSSLA